MTFFDMSGVGGHCKVDFIFCVFVCLFDKKNENLVTEKMSLYLFIVFFCFIFSLLPFHRWKLRYREQQKEKKKFKSGDFIKKKKRIICFWEKKKG